MLGSVLGIGGLLLALVILPTTVLVKALIACLVLGTAVRASSQLITGRSVSWGAALRAAVWSLGLLMLMLVSLVFMGKTVIGSGGGIDLNALMRLATMFEIWLIAVPLSFVLAFRAVLGLDWVPSALVALMSTVLAAIGFWGLTRLV